jgi:hypothetical protein
MHTACYFDISHFNCSTFVFVNTGSHLDTQLLKILTVSVAQFHYFVGISGGSFGGGGAGVSGT